MRIAHNITAKTTRRSYTTNNDKVAASNEKLSSGLGINKAADDTAGLAISEKMRAQVRGLDMATRNSQDAISLIQTAEGAMQEVHSMLDRMVELAVQSNTGTNENVDRSIISAEFEELKKEIDHISKSTTFNGMNVLDGTMGGGSLTVKTTNSNNVSVSGSNRYQPTDMVPGKNLGNYSPATSDFRINSTGPLTASKPGSYRFAVGVVDEDGKFTNTGVTGITTHVESKFVEEDTGNEVRTVFSIADVLKADEANFNITLNLSAIGLGETKMTMDHFDNKRCFENAMQAATLTTTYQNVATKGGAALSTANVKEIEYVGGDYARFTMDVLPGTGGTVSFKNLANGKEIKLDLGVTLATAGKTTEIDLEDIGLGKLYVTAESTSGVKLSDFASLGLAPGGVRIEGAAKGNGAITIQVGADKGDTIDMGIRSLTSTSLGVSDLSIDSLGEAKGTAGEAIDGVRKAINLLSEQRSLVGAVENRLNYKINNLKVASLNLSEAESRIRDLDMAKEITNYTKFGILSQAATSMMAQANTAPQQVLTLMQ